MHVSWALNQTREKCISVCGEVYIYIHTRGHGYEGVLTCGTGLAIPLLVDHVGVHLLILTQTHYTQVS